jgi:hypothetical protein
MKRNGFLASPADYRRERGPKSGVVHDRVQYSLLYCINKGSHLSR